MTEREQSGSKDLREQGGRYNVLRTPSSVLRPPSSVLRTPHSVLRPPYSVLRTPSSVQGTPHGVLEIQGETGGYTPRYLYVKSSGDRARDHLREFAEFKVGGVA